MKKIKNSKNNMETIKKPVALSNFGKFQRRHQLTRIKPIVLDEKKTDRIFYPSLKY